MKGHDNHFIDSPLLDLQGVLWKQIEFCLTCPRGKRQSLQERETTCFQKVFFKSCLKKGATHSQGKLQFLCFFFRKNKTQIEEHWDEYNSFGLTSVEQVCSLTSKSNAQNFLGNLHMHRQLVKVFEFILKVDKIESIAKNLLPGDP